MNKRYCVYIFASRSRNLYIGVTNNLRRRLVQHRLGLVPGFTSRYKIFRLVYYEVFGDIRLAIAREKEIKAWRREKKLWLIQRRNPAWQDRAADWFGTARKQPAKPQRRKTRRAQKKQIPHPRPKSGRVRDDKQGGIAR